MRKIKPRINQILAKHMQNFAATASREEMAIATEQSTYEEERIDGEEGKDDSSSNSEEREDDK